MENWMKMARQGLRKRFWLVLVGLGVLAFVGVLAAHGLRSISTGTATGTATGTPPVVSASPQTPAASIAPFPSVALPAAPSPGTNPSATPKAASSPSPSIAAPVPQSTPVAPLTSAQAAMNEQAKAEFQATMATVDSVVEMQVVIAEGVSSLSIGSSTEAELLDENWQPIGTLSAGGTYTAAPGGSGITLGSLDLPAIVWLKPAGAGLVRLGDRSYRGELLLVNDAGRLWGVNKVSLRRYLHSVVASEVSPSWTKEALKAQAVAARSYALTYYFKPMSSLFHLGATEYYQVYTGVDREDERTSQAVDETAGEYVSYKGDIVESLYAASEDIVAEAFQGHGMSQLGALDLAEQGYTYEQILGRYYPGTKVGRIKQDF